MPELCLDIHGISLLLESDSAATLEALSRDFEYFVSPCAQAAAPIRLALVAGRAPEDASRGLLLLSTREFSARDAGRARRVDYSDGAVALYDFARRRGALYCARLERLHELAYLCVLSRAGEELDGRGLHRVHALGFSIADAGGLLLLPSGGGKSTLALELTRTEPSVKILSDDTPLLGADGRLRPFPLRWAFGPSSDLSRVPERFVRPFQRRQYGPKRVVDLGFFRERVGGEVPLRWLIVGRPGGAAPALEPIGRAAALAALSVGLVVGLGVPQMAEYRLRARPADVWGLVRDAFGRSRAALRAVSRARLMRFTLGRDPAVAARALVAGLKDLC